MADRLPTELIEHIFTFAVRVDMPTCAAICRTNKMGHGIALPVLYHTAGITRHDGRDDAYGVDDRLERIALLCRTLLENRQRAQEIVGLKQYCDDMSLPTRKSLPALDRVLITKVMNEELPLRPYVKTALREQLNEVLRSWDSPTHGPCMDVFLGLLALLCPNITSIEIQGDIRSFFPAYEILCALGENHAISPTLFVATGKRIMHVEELIVNNVDQSDSLGGELLDLLGLPGLRILRVKGLKGFIMDPWPSTDREVDIEELYLERCDMDQESIDHLLIQCPWLRILDIDWLPGCFEETDIDADCFDLFASYLSSATPWLERLTIDVAPISGVRGNFLKALCSLKPLRSLTVPRFLLLQPGAVLHHDQELIVPPSLEEVNIVADQESFSADDYAIFDMPWPTSVTTLKMYNRSKSCCITKDDFNRIMLKRKASAFDSTELPAIKSTKFGGHCSPV